MTALHRQVPRQGCPTNAVPTRQNNHQGVTMFSTFRNTTLAAIITGAMAAWAPHAAEATVFDFSFTGLPAGGLGNASGMFDVTGNLITGISGTTSNFWHNWRADIVSR